jgi:hypothetical protein
MKTLSISLIAVAAACGLASAQTAYTTPVGYTTQALPSNTFSLFGLNVHQPTLAAGVLTDVSGAVLTDSNIDFTTVLPAGKTCIVEITDGTAAGTVQEFISWTGNTITLPAPITGIAIGNKYAVRQAAILQDIFTIGTGGIAGSVVATTADKIWLQNANGTYTRYWYKTNAPIGWRLTTTGANDAGAAPDNIAIPYIDAVLIEKRAVAGSIVLTGEVKKTGSNAQVIGGFNLLGITPPIGLTLFTSGIQGDITGSVVATTADIVWVPTGTGAYNRYWFKTNAPSGWRLTTTGSNDAGAAVDFNLPPGVFIQRKIGTPTIVTFDVPAFYSNL